MTDIKFIVAGEPVTQGSMKAFMPPGSKFPRIVHGDGPKLKAWRKSVRVSAKLAFDFNAKNINKHPVAVRFIFQFVRPDSHYTTKSRVKLSSNAPAIPPLDLDKLVRAVCDALTGVCWADDKQVSDIVAAKRYGDEAGLYAEISPIIPLDPNLPFG